MRTTQLTLSLLTVFALLVMASCASGGVNGQCDPADESCTCEGDGCEVDGSVIDPSDAGSSTNSDAGPMRGFGEACSDKGECASNICILVGIGGVCSDFCSDNSCPEEYGCFGVFGAVEPGEVADVCVPTSTQLCSPCEINSECAIVGSDLCVTNADERSFCARDCSAIDCPEGYTCSDVDVGGAIFQQCLPTSGACDCTAALSGVVEACSISTDFGTCAGTRACSGATGWDSCQPPAPTDSPDGAFLDDNCDGIDGTLDGGIFVAESGGADGTDCGLTYTDPCSSIGFGIIRALQSSRGELYVQAGDYNEVVVLQNGIDIYGGFDQNWQRDVHTDSQHRVTITGTQDTGSGGDSQFLTVRAHNLVVETILADLVIVGPDATGSDAAGARSSYAVHVDGAILDLQRVSIVAGNGASGQSGTVGQPGSSAFATTAMRGANGARADESVSDCDDSSHGNGGARGVNSCGTGRATNGGNGGNGGESDSSCTCFLGACACVGSPCNATNGDTGNNASHTFSIFGLGGAGGSGSSCSIPSLGTDGRIQNGSAGAGASGNGSLSGGYWFASSGGAGGLGQHGGGGGGGGGSGGCDAGFDSYGAGGGGGGAGGCAATSAGGGGRGGGGSFGVFATNASVTASECTIARGAGGSGGNGGTGGHGQRGGSSGVGGLADGDSKAGGAGGDGAHGGHGGGGGGGSGGASIGVYSSASTVTQDCVVTGGSGGSGGNGGLSAPSAPTADRDGNDGASGSSGALQGVAVCASPSSC